jgi:transcription elongation factor Elf1
MPNDYDSVDWMGRKFNHLMIIGYDKKRDGGFRCVCDCGKIISVRANKLLKSQVVSCGKCDIRLGIKQHEISTLGLRLDNIWKGMIQRL